MPCFNSNCLSRRAKDIYCIKKNHNTEVFGVSLHISPLTLFTWGGGPLWPGRPKIVCRFLTDCTTLPKFLDFVSFNVLQVPEESFSEKKIFAKNIAHCQKYPWGDPSMQKSKFSKKVFFFLKILSFLPEYKFYMISALFWGT